MELSILHIYIESGTYCGVLKFSIQREFHNLCIKLEAFKINTNARETIDIFKHNLTSDPNNPNIINIIPTKMVLKETYQLAECEKLLDYLSNIPKLFGNTQDVRIEFSKNLTCNVSMTQVKRIYNFFKSFVTNFAMIDSIYLIYINILKINSGGDLKEQPKASLPDLAPKQELKLETPIIETNIQIQKQLIETILNNYTINSTLLSFIVNHIFNHLQYITNNIKIDKINNTINISDLFNSIYLTNIEYTIDCFNTILDNKYDEIITFNQKKVLELIISIFDKETLSKEDNLNLIILFFIFYIYQYRFIVLKYPEYEIDNYFKIETQQSGINYFIKNLSPSKILNIIVSSQDDNTIQDESLIQEISDKYKHLIPISQEDFLELALKDYNSQLNNISQIQNFSVTQKKIIDISKLISIEKLLDKNLKNPSSLVNTSIYSDRSGLLNYTPDIITQVYKYFKDYLSNPESVTSVTNIPKAVISLFDFFSRNMQSLFKDKSITSTFEYYKILYINLPAPKSYSHYTYLYIIFNLIIPYYYDTYQVSEFTDIFI